MGIIENIEILFEGIFESISSFIEDNNFFIVGLAALIIIGIIGAVLYLGFTLISFIALPPKVVWIINGIMAAIILISVFGWWIKEHN